MSNRKVPLADIGVADEPSSLATRIAEHERAIDRLREQQFEEFLFLLQRAVAKSLPYDNFTARQIWHVCPLHSELREAFAQLGITGPRTFGKLLQRLQGQTYGAFRVERLDVINCGAVWKVGVVRDSNLGHCGPHRAGV